MPDKQEQTLLRCDHRNGTIKPGALFTDGVLEAWCPDCRGLWISKDEGKTWEAIPAK